MFASLGGIMGDPKRDTPIILPAEFVLAVNPEPWMAPKFNAVSKRTYAHPKMRNYKAALREEFISRYPGLQPIQRGTPLDITFMYVRSTSKGRPADATNLTKATEDALQRYLFHNDTDNMRVTSLILDQGPGVENTGVIILVDHYEEKPSRERWPASFEIWTPRTTSDAVLSRHDFL
jgi:Holliday junction resolvase RusA-like endonuclease